jgi:hypothetical protein
MKTFDFLFYQCATCPAHIIFEESKEFLKTVVHCVQFTSGYRRWIIETVYIGSLLKILFPPAWCGGTSKSSQSQYFSSRYIIILFDILTTAGIKHDAEEARGGVGFLRHAYKAFFAFLPFLSILFFFCVRKAKRLDRIPFFCKM